MIRPEVSLVIPAFNEEASLPSLLERVTSFLDALDAPGEVIIVDDHSSDRSQDLLREACARDPRIRSLRLASQGGSHLAILAGLEHSRGACAAFLAADLQNPPELILEMLGAWRGGSTIVWAIDDRKRGLLSRLYYVLARRVGLAVAPGGADFALLDRRAISALSASAGPDLSLGSEIARLGFNPATVRYERAERAHGKSKWRLSQKLRAFADAFAGHTYVPLRLMSGLGLLCTLLGLSYAVVVVIVSLNSEQPVQGWASLMTVVLILGGVQMTMMGVMGEYLWRTLEAARGRPPYVLESWAGFADEPIKPEGSRQALDSPPVEPAESSA